MVREGLRALLDAEPDFSIVGEACDGTEVEDVVKRKNPDVLLLDLMLPGLSGLEVTKRVSKSSPDTKICILSMHSSEAYVLEALRNGAFSYILKEGSYSELKKAIRQSVFGRRFLSPQIAGLAIEAYLDIAKSSAGQGYQSLTPREREVLRLTIQGHTAIQIARTLSVSPRTVEAHLYKLMRKLGLHTRAELIRYATRHDLTIPD